MHNTHPLTVLLAQRGWTSESYLRRVRAEYIRRGYGQNFATRKEKVSRWTADARPQVPTRPTQLAMAAVLGISPREVQAQGWPNWLLAGLQQNDGLWELPWTAAGTIQALDHDGGPVDRRHMLIASTGTVAAVIAQWATAHPSDAQSAGQRIDASSAARIDDRLTALRHLDDDLGADVVYDAAVAEIRLARRLLRDFTYSEDVGRRLFASAAEAARLAGWCAYDSGRLQQAERHYHQSLRAAGSAGDRTAGAVAAAFWSIVRYSGTSQDSSSALDMLDNALSYRGSITSPRVVTLLYIRQARAHSVAGNSAAAYRAVDAALSAYDRGGPPSEDLERMYWVNAGEIFQAAGSAALTVGDPRRALDYFDAALTHADPYDAGLERRGTAIYEARRAAAYLALGDVDGAVETAERAVELMGGVSSARASGTLAGLRRDLASHRRTPVVAEFLASTG
ncbi:transcriptional regulator [Actinacidiphila sp. DG2A-62]|uniref:transcriptional regulator n=1 Tax=Actinacidiphila sp. DG2A-62 TaxID=3108821 RepID=UPI002DB8413D|nr:transcriptional regulator [Actinacidiphila sp. DG2A-62]MEC3995040.1 transcriptional regulator [Actinacidiphila sp. DG2A-62]